MKAPALATSALQVIRFDGKDALEALAYDWNRLAHQTPFSSHAMLGLWLKHFAPDNPVHVLAVHHASTPLAFAPFIERQGRLLGMPVKLWQSPSNEHSQRFEWSHSGDASEAIQALWQKLKAEDWEVLLLKDVVEAGVENQTLQACALNDEFLVWQWPSLGSPWLKVPTPGAPLNVSSKFKANLRRRRRKLQEVGKVSLQSVSHGENVDEFLAEGFRLEASGWKGRENTAILSSPVTEQYYRQIAHIAAQQGWLRLYLLYAGSRPVAFHYGLAHQDTYFLLKPGYDEALKECSPGQLLVEDVLDALAQEHLAFFDFLGPKMDWKMEWTQNLRPHVWTFVLRPTAKGRWLHAARFQWGPRLKRWLSGLSQGKLP